jgi:hypothetical protein
MIKSMPEVAGAAHSGQPNLTPPDDAISATDVLKPGASGPSFTLAMRPAATQGVSADTPDSGAPVEAVPGSSDSSGAPGNNLGVSIIEAPNERGGDAATTPSTASEPQPNPTPAADNPSAPPTITLEPTTASTAPAAASPEPAAAIAEAPGNTQATTSTGGGTIAPVVTAPQKAAKADTKTESTSKKKKGIHKVIPF